MQDPSSTLFYCKTFFFNFRFDCIRHSKHLKRKSKVWFIFERKEEIQIYVRSITENPTKVYVVVFIAFFLSLRASVLPTHGKYTAVASFDFVWTFIVAKAENSAASAIKRAKVTIDSCVVSQFHEWFVLRWRIFFYFFSARTCRSPVFIAELVFDGSGVRLYWIVRRMRSEKLFE